MAALSPENMSSAIGGFYDAAVGRAEWREALDGLAGCFHGSRAWLFHTTSEAVSGYTSLDDPGFETPAAKQAILRDPFHLLSRSLAPGRIALHSRMQDVAAFHRRELWQEWLRPRELYYGMQCAIRVDAGSHFLVDVNRAAGQGDFDADDERLMSSFLPHIARAGEISALFHDRKHPGLPVAVAALVVDRHLRLRDINAAAADLLARTVPPVDIRQGVLELAPSRGARRIASLLEQCMSGDGSGGVALLGPDAGNAGARLVVSVAPWRRGGWYGLEDERQAVLFLRPAHGAAHASLDEALVAAFGLTASQARLARALLGARDLRQAAAERGLSYASARTYLDEIFRRTGTRRQPELVALLKSVEAGLADMACPR